MGKTPSHPNGPDTQPHAGPGGPFRRNACLFFFQKKLNFNIKRGTDVERGFVPLLLTRRFSTGLAPTAVRGLPHSRVAPPATNGPGRFSPSPLRWAFLLLPVLRQPSGAGNLRSPAQRLARSGRLMSTCRVTVKWMKNPYVHPRAHVRGAPQGRFRKRDCGVRGPRTGLSGLSAGGDSPGDGSIVFSI